MSNTAQPSDRAPLTPADCDISDFPRMWIDIPRLRASSFDATTDSEGWRCGLNLWFSAWHRTPAASLEADEQQLCKFAGLGRDIATWQRVRDVAMRGWVLCSDGLLYHETVAEMALESWLEKLAQRVSSGAGNARRYKHTFDAAPIYSRMEEAIVLLSALNPQSRVIARNRRRLANGTPDNLPSGDDTAPDGRTPGGKKSPVGNPAVVPSRSQETGTGTETGNYISISLVAEGDDEGREVWFAALWREYPHVKGRSSQPKSRAAFDAIPEAIAILLPEAARQFRLRGKHPSGGAPSMVRWLDEELWRDWLDDAPAPPTAPSAWGGPDELREKILRFVTSRKGGRAAALLWAVAYLDHTTWSEVPPAIVCQSPTVEKHLRDFLGHLLRDEGVTVLCKPSEAAA